VEGKNFKIEKGKYVVIFSRQKFSKYKSRNLKIHKTKTGKYYLKKIQDVSILVC